MKLLQPVRPNAGEPTHASWHRMVLALLAIVLAIMLVGTVWVSERALSAFDRMLLPEFERGAVFIGKRIGGDVERAVELGIALEELRGIEPFLAEFVDEHPAVGYIALLDRTGTPLAVTGPRRASMQPLTRETVATLTNEVNRADTGEVRETFVRIGTSEDTLGFVRIGRDAEYVARQISDIRWDVAVVLIVSILITFELLVFVIDRSITTPLRLIERTIAQALTGNWPLRSGWRGRRDEAGRVIQRLETIGERISSAMSRIDRKLVLDRNSPTSLIERANRIRARLAFSNQTDAQSPASAANARLPLFLFVLAEELSRSFLPLYAQSIYRPIIEFPVFGDWIASAGDIGDLSKEFVVGLPIVVFMLTVALATPFGGSWVARLGARRLFLFGAIPAGVGFIGTGLAVSTWDMLVWRCLSGLGYALITIACQDYLAHAGDAKDRGRNMAIFVTAVITAVICGSSLGGVLADRLGYRAVFLISGGLVAIATLIAWSCLERTRTKTVRAKTGIPLGVLINGRLFALIVLIAIPAKIALAGFLFYVAPLFLDALGASQPTIGRSIMLYGLAMLAGTQLGPWFCKERDRSFELVVAGGLLTGLALLLPSLFDGVWPVNLTITIFGLAQGLAGAPMLALAPRLCPDEVARSGPTAITALLRLSERIGSALGPILAAGLALRFGFQQAILVIGGLSAVAALAYSAIALAQASRNNLASDFSQKGS